MAKFLFVRHGDADYTYCIERGFIGHGNDLAQLSDKGIEQINNTALDSRLKGADILISSPYTRALQSAAIISRKVDMEINVEIDVHEWLPDKSFQFNSFERVSQLSKDFLANKGIYPRGEEKLWEEYKSVKTHVNRVLEKYKHLKKVIIVCHGYLIGIATGKSLFEEDCEEIHNGEIVELIYD